MDHQNQYEYLRCPICASDVPKIPDGKMRFCQCRKMGVDHTKEYTRVTGGIIPVNREAKPEVYTRKTN